MAAIEGGPIDDDALREALRQMAERTTAAGEGRSEEALLSRARKELQKMEFQDMLTFLQALPTKRWKESDVTELLAKAFQLKCLYDSSRSHLVGEYPSSNSLSFLPPLSL